MGCYIIYDIVLIEKTIEKIRLSAKQQNRFLKLLEDIRGIWKIQKVPFAAHVYDKGTLKYILA